MARQNAAWKTMAATEMTDAPQSGAAKRPGD
jgi:hypothetical protein